MENVQRADYWEARYREGRDGWDLGRPAPALEAWLAANPLPGGRAAVLGCGRGHDALAFAAAGWDVTGFDFAPAAIAEARRLAETRGLGVTFREADLFTLEDTAAFDLLVEHTCFCAIDPARRPDYVALTHRLLKPGGRLLAVFFTHGEPGGPPFGVTPAEVRALFEPLFAIESLDPVPNSVAERVGEEHGGLLRRVD